MPLPRDHEISLETREMCIRGRLDYNSLLISFLPWPHFLQCAYITFHWGPKTDSYYQPEERIFVYFLFSPLEKVLLPVWTEVLLGTRRMNKICVSRHRQWLGNHFRLARGRLMNISYELLFLLVPGGFRNKSELLHFVQNHWQWVKFRLIFPPTPKQLFRWPGALSFCSVCMLTW